MAALLRMCPPMVREQMILRMDEIGEDYEKLKANILTYTTNKVESGGGRGGPTPMEVDNVDVWWE